MSRPTLSKSKLLSYRQCPKRLWLEVHRPDFVEYDETVEQRFAIGHEVGEIARRLYGDGVLIDTGADLSLALRQTREYLAQATPPTLYEATVAHDDVRVKVDVLQPHRIGLRLIEVKASGSVKDVHYEDCAIQSQVLKQAGLPITATLLTHIDTGFVYPGGSDYRGLLKENDLTAEIAPIEPEVEDWIDGARQTLAGPMPEVPVGPHCTTPYDCPFIDYCWPEPAEYPPSILPYAGNLSQELEAEGYTDLRQIPEARLDKPQHRRIHRATVANKAIVDAKLGDYLACLPYPRHYLDFETIDFPIPIWPGTSPYQQLPFQWSLHVEPNAGELEHHEFLDTRGDAPMHACIEALIDAAGDNGPILVYSGFEKTILNRMRNLAPELAPAIDRLAKRLVDLLPLLRKHYYHPQMKGSWSIKKVLPTIAPHLDYGELEEIQEGGAAQVAYLELIDPGTTIGRKNELQERLLAYCRLDTLGMVEVVRGLGGG